MMTTVPTDSTLDHRAIVEQLPFDVIESISKHVHDDKDAGRAALLHFAISSAAFFAPAVRTALNRWGKDGPDFLVQREDETNIRPDNAPLAWIKHHGSWPQIGAYAVSRLPHDDATPACAFSLILPSRNEHRVYVPELGQNVADMTREARYWSSLPIPVDQVRYAQWEQCEVPVPACRALWASWPYDGECFPCPPSVERLTLDNVCPAAEEFQRLAQWLPPALRHLTLRFISSGDGDQLGTIYERLPPSLISLKLFNDEDGHEVLDEESAVSVARAFSTQLTNLTAFYHHFLPFPGLPLVLDALASRDTLMESLTLNLVAPEGRTQFLRGKNNRSTELRVQRMHIFANDMSENQNRLLSIVRSLPKPTRVLMVGLPTWPAACVDHVVQHLVVPGLRELHFDATVAEWLDTHKLFPLASVRADLLPISLESLTLPGGMPPGSLGEASHAGWTLPPSLKHLDLSGSQVDGSDLAFLRTRLPTGMVSLAMRSCGLCSALCKGLPSTIRVIDVSYNWELRQGPWIALLPPSLRKIKMENCPKINTKAAVAALIEAQRRAGMTRLGVPKLQIIGVKGIDNTGAAY
ncbi:hypothetical protein GGF31_008719 [Allomyces arbusculus]|nr:hypothetical protein GGF31_008719 [Allomyces arbusculus]